MVTIVKRRGHTQEFDERKVYASAYAACLNVHLSETEAENIANSVTEAVKSWLGQKEKVSSQEIFEKVKDELENHNTHAAFMYQTHRDIS